MDFVKNHYEKILLGVVLIGMAAAVAYLPIKIKSERAAAEEKRVAFSPKPVPLTNLDMTLPDAAMQRMASPAQVNFGPPNRLFNPMPWQRTPDGHLIPGSKVGPTAATVTNITPLYLRLTLDSIQTIPDSAPKYVIGVEKQAAASPAQRNKKQTYCTLVPPTKNDTFTMLEIRGKPEEPSEVIVQLNDTGDRAVITKENPFKRTDGYMADLRYEPERRTWTKQRVGANLSFNNEEYKIVVINQNEVVLSAPNQKKWPIKSNPAP